MQTREPRRLVLLVPDGLNSPFEDWFDAVSDKVARRRILVTIARLADPSYRTFKSVALEFMK